MSQSVLQELCKDRNTFITMVDALSEDIVVELHVHVQYSIIIKRCITASNAARDMNFYHVIVSANGWMWWHYTEYLSIDQKHWIISKENEVRQRYLPLV